MYLFRNEKRKLDNLVSGRTVGEGKKGSTRKANRSILIQFANEDMVALEVKNHKSWP